MSRFNSVAERFSQLMFPMDTCCISCHRDTVLNERLLCQPCAELMLPAEDPICQKCGHPIDGYRKGTLCKNCVTEHYAFVMSRGCFEYTDTIKGLIHRMKYDDQTYLARYFARDMALKYNALDWDVDAVISVPSHVLKTWDKGYHVSGSLAHFFSEETGIENISESIIKIRATESQVTLSGAERRTNLIGAFEAQLDLTGYDRILIIDDLFTTGSTMHEVAKTAKKAGVKEVLGLTLATSKRE